MLKALEAKAPLILMKNGLYYIRGNNGPLLNYSDVLKLEDGQEILSLYLDYRLEKTQYKLNKEKRQEIIDRYISSLLAFEKQEQIVSDVTVNEQWLYMPTYLLLSLGGDDRSLLDPNTLKNKYHTSTLPLYDYQRSSCTSSSISIETYLHIEQLHFNLIAAKGSENLSVEKVYSDQRYEILSYFISGSRIENTDLMITPSGTDVEFLCSWLGLLRSKEFYPQLDQPKVKVFISADLEVGSGTKIAAHLQHFNLVAPKLKEVKKEETIINENLYHVEVESFYTRDEQGDILDSKEVEQEVEQKVAQAIKNEQIVVFHYVHASKTGVSIPSFDFIKNLKQKFGKKIILIADAAQLRLKPESVDTYLALGFNIIITGSKFIGGSPFSGGLIVNNEDIKTYLESKTLLPESLNTYFDRFGLGDVIHREKQADWVNWGVFLRWEVALHEMKQFDRIPAEFSELFILKWRDHIIDYLESYKDLNIRVLKENRYLPQDESSLSGSNSVISFEIVHDPILTKDQLKSVHKKMAIKRFDSDIICEIGQPVQISTGENARFALRVALGAKNVIDAYRGTQSYNFDDCVNYLLNNDKKLLNKMFEVLKEEISQ